ncbi:MAG TPA: ORF6N domain-containing protein [bacterium]|nr:ORF6N domain-containing protein [bacterium]
MSELIPNVSVEQKIFIIRGMKVMLDADLAEMYGIRAKRFNRQVGRNIKRFPSDFMFQFTNDSNLN